MIQLTTACASSVDEAKGNTSNLLFSGQILPERNAGLNGAPSLKLEPGAACACAVFDGNGPAAREAAYLAASAFRSAADKLRSLGDLEALYAKIASEIAVPSTKDAFLSVSAVAACVDGDKLALASLGSCRAYLMRGRNLYLLSRESAAAAPEDQPPAPGEGAALGESDVKPFTVKGALLPGDQLLLCTGWLCAALSAREILRVLAESNTPSAALQQLTRRAGTGRGDMAAVLWKAEGVAEPEAPVVPPLEDVEAPAVEPEAPAVEPEAPAVEAEAPTAEPEAPAVEPEAPAVEPEAPAVEPEAPAVEPEAPAVEPEAPAVEPEAPAVEPEAPAVEPEAPAVEPEAPAVEPEAPAVEPEAPAVEPEASVEEPVEETAEAPVKESLEDIIEAAVKELSEE